MHPLFHVLNQLFHHSQRGDGLFSSDDAGLLSIYLLICIIIKYKQIAVLLFLFDMKNSTVKYLKYLKIFPLCTEV
jgi:hypothetical protein